jgi:multidrug transporter EmrE-like cation transporter
MTRFLRAKVSRESTDVVACWVVAMTILLAATGLAVAMLPELPAPNAFAVGIGVGAAWTVLAGAACPAFRRTANGAA